MFKFLQKIFKQKYVKQPKLYVEVPNSRQGAKQPAPRHDRGKPVPLAAAACVFDIVGESHRQDDIEDLAGEHDERGTSRHCHAVLRLEDDNRHDPYAVAVDIDGRQVGYLARHHARQFRDSMTTRAPGVRRFTCPAKIVGGFVSRRDGIALYGVKLGLVWPPEVA
jgi:hypothetical protein